MTENKRHHRHLSPDPTKMAQSDLPSSTQNESPAAMSMQAGIKEFYPMDKATESGTALVVPSTPAAPSILQTPPFQTTSLVAPTPSVPTLPISTMSSASVTPLTPIPAPLKRGSSHTAEPEPGHKRSRMNGSTRDDTTSTVSTDGIVDPEPNEPDQPDQPNEPNEPDEPDEPDQPNEPNEPDFPNGPPTVWAITRGDLCDSQNIFKSYQSGSHTKDNMVISLYIDKYFEPRDFLGRNKIITCAGGGREKKNGKGQYVRKNTKPQAVARLEAAVDKAIVVIMGKDHPAFPTLRLPKVVRNRGAFVELGTFMLTKVWKEIMRPDESEPEYPVWKGMLQTIDPYTKPWYWEDNTTSQDSQHPEAIQKAPAGVQEKTCKSCGEKSPQIFANAPWVCVQDGCDDFFKVGGKILSQIGDDNKELRYSEAFINQVTTYKKIADIPTMFEPLPEDFTEAGRNYGTELALRGGMTCPKCRCGSARKYWDRLNCRNCYFEYNMAPLPYPLSLVEEETKTHTKKSRVQNDGVTIKLDKDHVNKFVEIDEDGMSTRFVFMIKNANGDLIGTFVVERPSDAAKKAPGGADDLYTGIEAEGGNMKFQRNISRCPGSHAEQLTGHFQSNFGALYEFGPRGIGTQPFKDAPGVVLKSLVYLKHFGEKALESSQRIASRENYRYIAGSTLHMPQKPFNELLALAYRQEDKIGWHDDGEEQLTGVISTASFGSPGNMALRFKKSGKTLKNEATTIKKGETILEVQLNHGDVATMCDTRLQALTDHTVIPDKHSKRRYAMTSRTINFEHYKQLNEKEKLVEKSLTVDNMEKAAEIPDYALHFAYNGTTLGSQQEKAA